MSDPPVNKWALTKEELVRLKNAERDRWVPTPSELAASRKAERDKAAERARLARIEADEEAEARKAQEEALAVVWAPSEKELAQAEQLAAIGMKDSEIVAFLGYTKATAVTRKRFCQAFEAAIEKGRSRGVASVATSLFEQAKNGNVQAAKFWLQAVAKWSETQVVEHTGETKHTIQIVMPKMLSEEEWIRANAHVQQEETRAIELREQEELEAEDVEEVEAEPVDDE